MRKLKEILICMIICIIFMQPVTALASDVTSPRIYSSSSTVSPLSDIIKWRYKSVNYKLYKRLYNYSKGQWIGDWILVP